MDALTRRLTFVSPPTELHDEALISPRATAALTGLSPRTLEGMRLQGRGPAFVQVSSRCIRYRFGDLRDWIALRRRVTAEQQ